LAGGVETGQRGLLRNTWRRCLIRFTISNNGPNVTDNPQNVEVSMALTNAEIQARWRAKRNAEAKLAKKVLNPSRALRHDGELSQDDRGTAILKLLDGPISQEDRESIVMKALTTKGAEWAPGFVTWHSKWKPGKTKIRRRRPLKGGLLSDWSPDMLKFELSDLKLADHDLGDFLQGSENVDLSAWGNTPLTDWESLDPTARAHAEQMKTRDQEIAALKVKLKRARRNRAARRVAANPPPTIAADPK
jgi:hypothetical protein